MNCWKWRFYLNQGDETREEERDTLEIKKQAVVTVCVGGEKGDKTRDSSGSERG